VRRRTGARSTAPLKERNRVHDCVAQGRDVGARSGRPVRPGALAYRAVGPHCGAALPLVDDAGLLASKGLAVSPEAAPIEEACRACAPQAPGFRWQPPVTFTTPTARSASPVATPTSSICPSGSRASAGASSRPASARGDTLRAPWRDRHHDHADDAYEYFGALCDGVAECLRKVREQIRSQADVVKIMTTGGVLTAFDQPTNQEFSLAEARAIVEEATRSQRAVAAHAHGAPGIKLGARTRPHLDLPLSSSISAPSLSLSLSRPGARPRAPPHARCPPAP
jgi:hypothetical protein